MEAVSTYMLEVCTRLKLNSISIFVFIDQEHLSVSDAEVETVTVTQYDEAVIPCRPTSPDVDVKLTLIGGEAVSFNFGFLHLLYIYVHSMRTKHISFVQSNVIYFLLPLLQDYFSFVVY